MTVRAFIADQPPSQREIMTILRSWILDLGRHTQEKISADIPYFYLYGRLCYLHPQREGVDLGFTKGYELTDEAKLFESRGRKHLKTITFYSVTQLEEQEEALRHILNEAAILNEYRFKQQQKKKAK
jgi:hypothetical protein